MTTREETVLVEAPASQELGARAMKAEVAASLFGEEGEEAASIRVGHYEIIETIGAGGMGVVYAAWDQSLGRRVAIKVLPAELVGDARERARLIREAQALAKLSHPNVVHVYEVGEHEDGVFVAMELVEGSSIKQWQARDRRSVSQILDVYAQAGRGLEAAHRAGLVHRDFKPANALVGQDGRVRVLDFGLAQGPGLRAASVSATGRRLETSSPGSVTRTGAVAGTPAYMAPEQLAGREANARADQFSFCVALYEALVGCRPFDRAALTLADERELPAKGERRLPWGLRRALRRGLAMKPHRRWPDMEALLRALALGPRWRRRLWTWTGPVVLGVGALVAALVGRRAATPSAVSPEEICGLPDRGPPEEWNEPHKGRVREALRGTEQPFADKTWQEVQERLGEHAAQWGEVYSQSCREDDSDRYAQVTECLDRNTDAFTVVVDGLASVDETTVVRVGEVLDTLPSPRRCARPAEPSVTLAVAPSVEAVRALARARMSFAQGLYDRATAEFDALPSDDGSRGDSPERVALLEIRGRALAKLDQTDQAQQALTRAAARAVSGETRARALLSLMDLMLDRERWQSAEDYSKHAEAAINASGWSVELQADHYDLMGQLRSEGGGTTSDLNEAVDMHTRALGLRENTRAIARTKLKLANVYAGLGHREEATLIYNEVLGIFQARIGQEHPDYAMVLFNLGMLAFEIEDYSTARRRFERALKIEQATLGLRSNMAARTEVKLAQTLLTLGEVDVAHDHARSAWSVQLQLPEDHSDRRAALEVLASVEQDAGEYASSLEHQLTLVEVYGNDGDPSVSQNIAWLTCKVGPCSESRPWIDEARAQLEALPRDELPEEIIGKLPLLELYIEHVEALVANDEGKPRRALKILRDVRAKAKAMGADPGHLYLRRHIDKLLEEVDAVVREIREGK